MSMKRAAFLLIAGLGVVTMPLVPSDASACPRCNREGFTVSIIEGRFEHFHPITRTLRIIVESEEDSYEERVLVPGNVRPRRGDEVVRWGDIEQGMLVEVEVEESEVERQVTALRILAE